ncbi:2-polyprenyl-6-methoxyphenol hydroxylase-like FAD-dependent oxidoreductase [Caulobacter ginsengisoli]|uniref:2-polyprenyl-6-methoxyphenol hydroxylase-like FAD-dependent oxidoreductase n=1 Tax=Caulobacter ginsengisoli TaxID=400775 RepID=A0ABU0INT2_9CAUL|nr:NAD(P)/FAD-dependent oxidoreductase [Caulobacter ginsengisoli]MDQ0463673.1 2-polyprenyl-6-methoxyphenol hydroxylase-like FAD-dependent oxidoreductase [Caulobacter ginsengisoli]
MSEFHEVVIVGGGIGGSALASVLARRGVDVLLLEQTEVFQDRVRGEWIAPWGVAETQRVGLYDTLVKAGGHHITRHVTYDETRSAAESESRTLPLNIFAPGISGPLAIGNPHHCQVLFDEAVAAGAKGLRGANVLTVRPGAEPSVTYARDGVEQTVRARLIVGADGRTSGVREAAGITLRQDRPHHWFAGMLVDGAKGVDLDLQTIGTEGDFNFLTFPQGDGKVRVYGGYPLEQKGRFVGPNGQRAFLDAFSLACCPANEALVAGEPAGPVLSYFNNDSWTDQPFAEGVVLVGDAAGWNDPIIGLGLSITYRDVRTVNDILAAGDWSPAAFAPYAEERAERMRRLRFTAALTSALDAEFGPQAKARRARHFERSAADPSLGAHAFAVMAGPESLPPEIFTPEHRARVLEG